MIQLCNLEDLGIYFKNGNDCKYKNKSIIITINSNVIIIIIANFKTI